MSVIFQTVQNIPTSTGRISKAEFKYTLQSSDTEALYRLAPEMRERIAKVEGVRDVNSDLYIKNPQMGVEIDREKAAVYGVTIDQVRQEMFNAFGTRQVAIDLHGDQRLLGHPGEPAGIPDRHHGAVATSTSRPRSRHVGAARSGDATIAAVGPGRCKSITRAISPRSPSRSTWRLAFRSGRRWMRSSEVEREARLPASITTGFQGSAAVFQESLKGQGRARSGGDLRRLRAPRRALRELHPPDHHHFRPAVGGRRRADHADARSGWTSR